WKPLRYRQHPTAHRDALRAKPQSGGWPTRCSRPQTSLIHHLRHSCSTGSDTVHAPRIRSASTAHDHVTPALSQLHIDRVLFDPNLVDWHILRLWPAVDMTCEHIVPSEVPLADHD